MITEKEIYNCAVGKAKGFYKKYNRLFRGSIYDCKDIIQEALIIANEIYHDLKKGALVVTKKAESPEAKKNVIKNLLYKKLDWRLQRVLENCLNETQLPPGIEELKNWEQIKDKEEKKRNRPHQDRRFISLNDLEETELDNIFAKDKEKIPFSFSDIQPYCSPKEYDLLYKRFVERRTVQELGDVFGKTHQAITLQVQRICAKLKKRLKKEIF